MTDTTADSSARTLGTSKPGNYDPTLVDRLNKAAEDEDRREKEGGQKAPEAERRLAAVFTYASRLGPSILFFDEIDTIGRKRDDSHEASSRMLSVLLRKIDGIDAEQHVMTIGATNRKQDLDAALVSRFDLSVPFRLPNIAEREAIFALYAKHLQQHELAHVASAVDGASGRDIKDICQTAERAWCAELTRQGMPASPPALEFYRKAAAQRIG